MKTVFLRTGHNYDRDAVSAEVVECSGLSPTMAQQQFAEECDINTIVRRFGLTGELPDEYAVPVSGDFTDVVDFQTAMQAVRTANESFMRMPGELRARFNNDPQRLMDFVEDGRNLDEARKLGLALAAPEVTRTGAAVPVSPPA